MTECINKVFSMEKENIFRKMEMCIKGNGVIIIWKVLAPVNSKMEENTQVNGQIVFDMVMELLSTQIIEYMTVNT